MNLRHFKPHAKSGVAGSRVVEPDVATADNAPVDRAWDSFFLSHEKVTDDFMPERADQQQDERKAF